jgi:hypothetical protein
MRKIFVLTPLLIITSISASAGTKFSTISCNDGRMAFRFPANCGVICDVQITSKDFGEFGGVYTLLYDPDTGTSTAEIDGYNDHDRFKAHVTDALTAGYGKAQLLNRHTHEVESELDLDRCVYKR